MPKEQRTKGLISFQKGEAFPCCGPENELKNAFVISDPNISYTLTLYFQKNEKKGNMTLELIEAILLNVTLRRDVNNLDFQTFCDEN